MLQIWINQRCLTKLCRTTFSVPRFEAVPSMPRRTGKMWYPSSRFAAHQSRASSAPLVCQTAHRFHASARGRLSDANMPTGAVDSDAARRLGLSGVTSSLDERVAQAVQAPILHPTTRGSSRGSLGLYVRTSVGCRELKSPDFENGPL